jgi:hypothetical protein
MQCVDPSEIPARYRTPIIFIIMYLVTDQDFRKPWFILFPILDFVPHHNVLDLARSHISTQVGGSFCRVLHRLLVHDIKLLWLRILDLIFSFLFFVCVCVCV